MQPNSCDGNATILMWHHFEPFQLAWKLLKKLRSIHFLPKKLSWIPALLGPLYEQRRINCQWHSTCESGVSKVLLVCSFHFYLYFLLLINFSKWFSWLYIWKIFGTEEICTTFLTLCVLQECSSSHNNLYKIVGIVKDKKQLCMNKL